MRLMLVQRQSQRLNQTQRQQLKILQAVRFELKDLDIPNPTKGLEGIKKAHQILQEKESFGVLIGGLAEAIWKPKVKVADLLSHKDVDVAVLNEGFQNHDFEGGIDWWTRREGRILENHVGGSVEREISWYQNVNEVVLSFGIDAKNIQKDSQTKPGLYIPKPNWIAGMREYEALANIDVGRVDVDIGEGDEDVLSKFRDNILKKMGASELPNFLREEFQDFILQDYSYGINIQIDIKQFSLETVRGIKRVLE